MEVLVLTPFRGEIQTGNRRLASQWADHMAALGHEVTVAESFEGQPADLLVALHASHTHDSIVAFQREHPGRPVVVALTGSDIYPGPDDAAIDSMRRADRIVTLQQRARAQVPDELGDRVRLIVQAAPSAEHGEDERTRDPFVVAVVAHIRDAKDPLRTAEAARRLPATSRIEVRLAGAILEDQFVPLLEREAAENPRFRWLGEIGYAETARLMAHAQLTVVSSQFEGGGRVVGESIVLGTPVLGSRCAGVVATLGDDYPGLFEIGDTDALARMMERAETDPEFLTLLTERCARLAAQFEPAHERDALSALLRELDS